MVKKFKIIRWSKTELKLRNTAKLTISYTLKNETFRNGIGENRGIKLFSK
jgi:hypothetical protein